MAYYTKVERGGLGLTIPIPGIQIPGAGDVCDPKSINWDAQLCSQEVSSQLPSLTTVLVVGGIGLLAVIFFLRG